MEDTAGDARQMDEVDMTSATCTSGDNFNAGANNINDDNDDNLEQPLEDPDNDPSSQVARRFLVWIILVVTNIICIIAIALGRRKDSAAEKWAVSLVTLSFVGSLAALLCYQFVRSIFVSGPFELGLSVFIFILWCAGLAIIMNPSNSIAVGYTQIVNGNLYMSSWAAFISIFWMVGDLVGELYGYNDMTSMITTTILNGSSNSNTQISARQQRQGKWYALVGASVVVMASSVRVFQSFKCQVKVMHAAPVCIDSKIGIGISVVATVFAMLITLTGCCVSSGSNIARISEYVGAGTMIGLWSAGLGFITFGEGPGHSVGNLFFATWFAFMLSGWIAGECFIEWRSNNKGITDTTMDAGLPCNKQGQTELSDYASSNGLAGPTSIEANSDDAQDIQQVTEML